MTLDEFLVALEKTPRDGWTTRAVCIGAIRRDLRYCVPDIFDCPLSAVAGTGNCGDAKKAARLLGIDMTTCRQIMKAADEAPGYDEQLRAKLLKACGLA